MSNVIELGKAARLTFTDPSGDVSTFSILQGYLYVDRKTDGALGWNQTATYLPLENAVALRDYLDGYIRLFGLKK